MMTYNRRIANYERYEYRAMVIYRAGLRKYLKKQAIRIAAFVEKFPETKEFTEREIEDIAWEIVEMYDFYGDMEELQELIKQYMMTIGNMGNNLANIQLYSSNIDYKPFSIIEDKYTRYIDDYSLIQAEEITHTTKKRTRKVIKDGMLQGKSYSQIAVDIVDKTDIESLGRAKTIATTEVHTSFMTSRHLNAEQGNFKEKLWLTSGDRSVRPLHQEYGSLGYVPYGYMYGGAMLYPGDPNGFAGDVINCRCEIVYR